MGIVMVKSGSRRLAIGFVSAACFATAVSTKVDATEYAFSTYGLGSAAFGAGMTPPAGTYVTFVSSYYSAKIGADIDFGGVVIDAGAKVKAFASAFNLLHVPQREFLGGHLGFAITIPAGHVDIDATVTSGLGTISQQTDGWGFGDIIGRAQLGWTSGELSYLIYLQGVAPTGRYEPGFFPIIGLNRPSIDIGAAFTWANKATKLQFNGSLGFTFNFENDETDYDSGNEFHFEWAIGYEISQGLVIGVVGYDYRQLTGDKGGRVGPFKGEVDAIGAGLSYTTLVGQTPITLNLRHYEEYHAKNRWEGSSTITSGTVRF